MSATHPVVDALAGALGAGDLLVDAEATARYLVDWRGLWRGRTHAVARPRSTDEVAAVVTACASHGVAVVPHGGNTSLCGGAIPAAAGDSVVLSLERMNRIRAVDRAGGTLVAEAGCTLAAVQAAAAAEGRLFPLSMGSEGSALIGGAISTNAGGTGVFRYGNTRDLVLGLEVVLPDGAVWNGLRALRKDNTGYDLKHLFIGAEGTLGVITAATLRLVPRPVEQALAWVALASPRQAVALLAAAQERFDTRLTAFELLNGAQVELVVSHLEAARRPLAGRHAWHLLVELSDPLAGSAMVEHLTDFLGEAAESGLVEDATIATSVRQAEGFWLIRHALSDVNRDHGVSVTLDVAVPVSAVPAFVAAADEVVGREFPLGEVLVVSHLGDGNVHYIVQFAHPVWARLEAPEDVRHAIFDRLHDVAIAHGGSFSAEHGVGAKLVTEMRRYKSPTELAMMRAVKSALDPTGLMNPGKVLPPPSSVG
ncbi:MAG: FAD-binding oxidoreductase [Ectothiorhodospiraceae bacterium]|nr:FAD-binding oxidoreductase [Chromatiales bacterium]MCP5154858.1 FAD-binding oxidoreductase [Ectothiorhodospiraceae bacterium]